MIEIRNLDSIVELTYLMTHDRELLNESIIVNPSYKDIVRNKVVIVNRDYELKLIQKPLEIIDRRENKYILDPNEIILNNSFINPNQNRLVMKLNGYFIFNPSLLIESTNDWDYIYYLRYQLGLECINSMKALVYKEYKYLGMNKIDLYNFKRGLIQG